MNNYDKEIVDDKLTQADLIKLMLHNAQHMATREEVKSDINKLETVISKVELSLKADMAKLDQKVDKLEGSLRGDMAKLDQKVDKLEGSLRGDMAKLDQKIDKVEAKFDRLQWLIVATILTVLLKDYVFSLMA